MPLQFVPCEVPEPAFGPLRVVVALLLRELEALVYLHVKVLQELVAGAGDAGGDLAFEFGTEASEGGVDLVAGTASLVDVGDAALEVYPGLQGAENLVGGAED